jgi:outer membrane protein assembly factor BamB
MNPKQRTTTYRLTALVAIVLVAACAGKKSEPAKKPTKTLIVTLSEGVDGFPSAGTSSYDSALSVNYGYQLKEGFSDLVVTLDGATVSASGSFTMDANHTLNATCFKRVLWKYIIDSAVYYSCPAIGDDGTVYFGTGMFTWKPGTLFAMTPDGVVKWSSYIGNALYSPVIGNDGTVYVQDFKYIVYAYDPAGGLKWTFNALTFFYPYDVGQRNPAIGGDGTIYIGADGLYAVDPQTGQKIWHFAHPQSWSRECLASPVVGQDGTIYVTIGEDMLFAVTPNGQQKWVFAFAHDWEMSFTSPAIDQNGVIYLASEGKDNGLICSRIYAVNPDGSQRWVYPVDDNRFVRASPAVGPDGRIYIATKANEDGLPAKLIVLSPDGQKVWDYTVEQVHQTPDDSYSSPSLGADGLIYFGAETGFLYALNPDGSLNWKFPVEYGINWSSPALAPNGTLFIGTVGGADFAGRFYAFKTTSLGYAAAPWPRFRHDRKNTGRYGAR